MTENTGKHNSSDSNMQNYFDASGDIIIVAGYDSKIIYANKALTKKLGYTLEELQKMELIDLHPKDQRAEAARILTAMFKKELSVCQLELAGKEGGTLPVETRIWFGEWNGEKCIFGSSRDISVEQEALNKFAKIFRVNPEPMALSTIPEGVFVDVNEALLSKLGYSRAELIGKTAADLGLFPEAEHQLEASRQLEKNGVINNVALKVNCKNGSIMEGLFFGEIVEHRKEKLFLTVMIDITEQHSLLSQVKEEKQKLENTLKGAHLGRWEWNVQTGETVFDERWAEIIGYTLEELKPMSVKTWRNYSHPEELKEAERLLSEHFVKKNEYYVCEIRMKRKDESWAWVLATGKVIEWDDQGRPLKMYGTHLDITEKKKEEERVRRIEKQLRTLTENVPGMLFHLVREPSGALSMPEASEAIINMFGCSPEDVVGDFSPILNVIIPEDKARVLDCLEQSAKQLTSFDCEYRVQIPGKAVRWIYSKAMLENLPGGRTDWFGLSSDITERKRELEAVNHAQKLESLGVLAGGIAHDFNNLFAIIFGNIELSRNALRDNPGVTQTLNNALVPFERAVSLTQQLLSYSKGGAPYRKKTEVEQLLIRKVNFALSGSNVSVKFSIAKDLPTCDVDENQIGQVIEDIVINSVQAMPDGGVIAVSAFSLNMEKEDLPSDLLPGRYVAFEFKDNGVGIPADIIEKIFDPFFTTKQGSSGMGLSTADKVVKKHKGFLLISSEIDKGTLVKVYLPVSRQKQVEPKEKRKNIAGPARILVMDDEVMILELAKSVLETAGYLVVPARHGIEALALVKEAKNKGEPIDLMILDLTVPGGMGGKETVLKLREFDKLTPVICSSGYSRDEVMSDPAKYGFADRLPKPYRVKDMLEVVANNL